MRDIIIGGLLLPLRLYLQPTAFVDQIAALAPELPRGYSLWQARHKLREPAFRRGLMRLISQILVVLLWAPGVAIGAAAILSYLGYQVNWDRVAGGIVAGTIISLFVSVVGIIGSTLMSGSIWAALWVPIHLFLVGVGGVLIGVSSSLLDGLAGGLIVGLVLGLMILGMGAALYGPTRGVPFILIMVMVVVTAVVAILVNYTANVVVVIVAMILTVAHLLTLPIHLLLALVTWLLLRLRPALAPTLWRWSSVRWDEIILLPLPGLVALLVALQRHDPARGRAALATVAAHRFQRRAVPRALLRLAQEDAFGIASLPALAAFARSLDWLTEQTDLPNDAHTALAAMRDISDEIASAEESDSATNRVRRLSAAATLLEKLRLAPGPFARALARWEPLIATGLDHARRQQREQEPIPQIYITDGRPIHPADRPDTALPFKGRTALFQRLESALGGSSGERSTYLLYGQRRAGKTSALLQLPRRLGRTIPAFLDAQDGKIGGANNTAGLLAGIAETIIDQTHRYRALTLPPIDHNALNADPYPTFERWLDRLETILGDRTLLLCLDEFENLEQGIADGRFDTRLLAQLRTIVQHRRRIAVLLSGSHHLDELPAHWASALINTTPFSISFLAAHDARALIETPIEGFPAIYTPAAIEHIIVATHCQPYLVQLLCGLLVERMNHARRIPPESLITPDDIHAVQPRIFERGESYLLDLWANQSGGPAAQHILEHLAHAPATRLDRATLQRAIPDETTLRAALRTLVRREIIERDGDDYRIIVPLIAAYIRHKTDV